jgi:hypothetical protein
VHVEISDEHTAERGEVATRASAIMVLSCGKPPENAQNKGEFDHGED